MEHGKSSETEDLFFSVVLYNRFRLTGYHQVDQEYNSIYTVIWLLKSHVLAIYNVMSSECNIKGTTLRLQME